MSPMSGSDHVFHFSPLKEQRLSVKLGARTQDVEGAGGDADNMCGSCARQDDDQGHSTSLDQHQGNPSVQPGRVTSGKRPAHCPSSALAPVFQAPYTRFHYAEPGQDGSASIVILKSGKALDVGPAPSSWATAYFCTKKFFPGYGGSLCDQVSH